MLTEKNVSMTISNLSNKTFLFLIILLSACAKLPVYNAKWKPIDSNATFTGYDKESALKYTISNDSSNLYIALTTSNKPLINSIRKEGLTTHIGFTKKKKGQFELNYPHHSSFQKNMDPDKFEKNWKASLKTLTSNTEALWTKGDESEVIPIGSKYNDFNGQVRIEQNGDLNYAVTIPFNELGYHTISLLPDQIVLGLETKAMSPARQPQPSEGMSSGMSRGGGGRGGGKGSGMGRGMNGGMPGSKGGSNQTMNNIEPLSLWFQIIPSKQCLPNN